MAVRSRKRRRKHEELGVIWEVPDALWERIRPILDEYWPAKATGRKHAEWRQCLNGIVFRMRTGCQWNYLPKQFGDDSTVHRWFQRWNRDGVMKRIWAELVSECDELGGLSWDWQSADGALAKARFGGIKSAPIPRIEVSRARNAA
jgi:putative transposase